MKMRLAELVVGLAVLGCGKAEVMMRGVKRQEEKNGYDAHVIEQPVCYQEFSRSTFFWGGQADD